MAAIAPFALFAVSLAAPGEVSLSDGTVLAGAIDLPDIKLFDAASKKSIGIAAEDVAVLRTVVEKEELVQAWVFVEESSREKIKLPEWYPARRYAVEVFLKGGQVLRGHVNATSFTVALPDEDRRLIIRSQQKGETGQQPGDLVYVREIRLAPIPPAARLAELVGTAAGARLAFLLREGSPSGTACPVAADGRFSAGGLVPGRHFACFAAGAGRPIERLVRGTRGSPLAGEKRAEIEALVAESREFFDEKRLLAAGAIEAREGADAPPAARALVGMRRRGRTSAGDATYVRYDLWKIEKGGPRWEVSERVYLFREVLDPATPHAWPAAVELAELAGIAIAPGANELRCGEAVANALAQATPAGRPERERPDAKRSETERSGRKP